MICRTAPGRGQRRAVKSSSLQYCGKDKLKSTLYTGINWQTPFRREPTSFSLLKLSQGWSRRRNPFTFFVVLFFSGFFFFFFNEHSWSISNINAVSCQTTRIKLTVIFPVFQNVDSIVCFYRCLQTSDPPAASLTWTGLLSARCVSCYMLVWIILPSCWAT